MDDVFAKVLGNVAAEAEKSTVVNDNDYIGDDGLLVCGNCHTPKQVRVHFLDMEKTPFCLCKCAQEKLAAEERARKEAEKAAIIAARRNAAFPDIDSSTPPEEDMRGWTFDKDNGKQPQLIAAAKKYVESFDHFRMNGKGLLLYGSVGVGKTFAAACIANALIDREYSVLVTTFDRIEKTTFGMRTGRQEYFDSLNRYSLLVLDDLGAERGTEYMQEIVYSVIDGRIRANRPMIITSNLTSQQLKNPETISEQRIYSRILKMCHPICIVGDDQRKQKAVEEYADTKRILGM